MNSNKQAIDIQALKDKIKKLETENKQTQIDNKKLSKKLKNLKNNHQELTTRTETLESINLKLQLSVIDKFDELTGKLISR